MMAPCRLWAATSYNYTSQEQKTVIPSWSLPHYLQSLPTVLTGCLGCCSPVSQSSEASVNKEHRALQQSPEQKAS